MNMKDLPTYLNFGKKSKDLYESVSRPRTKGIGLEKSSCDVNELSIGRLSQLWEVSSN